MKILEQPERPANAIPAPLPAKGEPVVAQCERFACLAYRLPNGKWMGFFNHEELPNVLWWTPLPALTAKAS
jgi:hypothetical protein